MTNTGKFIVIEGIDGCGKSTQAQLLVDRLKAVGREVRLLREPGTTVIGQAIRSILLNPDVKDMDHRTELLLYMAARAQLTTELIRPLNESGVDVVADRWAWSTYAYQFKGLSDADEFTRLTCYASHGIYPDISFILTMDAQDALKRIKSPYDRIEMRGLEYFKTVGQRYLTIDKISPTPVQYVDASMAVDSVSNSIFEYLQVNKIIPNEVP
jgi:dTMP kinase